MMKTVFAVFAAALLSGSDGSQFRSARHSEAVKDPESVALIDSIDGPALYQAYCAVCHGVDARGEGPMSSSLRTAPPDLTRITARHAGTYPEALIERIISGEEQLPAGHGSRDMPVWGPIFSQVAWDQDLGRLRIHNLAIYIRRIQER